MRTSSLLCSTAAQASMSERQAKGLTSLMFAAAANRLDVVRVLVKRGADTKMTSVVLPPGSRGRGPAPVPNAGPNAGPSVESRSQCASRKHPRRLAQTLPWPAPKRSDGRGPTGLGGWTALHLAAREGHGAVAQALIELGADINERNEGDKDDTALHGHHQRSLRSGRSAHRAGADPIQTSDDGLAPLYATIDMQFAPVIWQPNPPTDQEQTTYLNLMSLLLDRGADPNARLKRKLWFRPSDHDDAWTGTAGTTAFWRAAFATDVEAMRVARQQGCRSRRFASSEGVTPLMAAAGLGWTGNQHRTVPGGWLPAAEVTALSVGPSSTRATSSAIRPFTRRRIEATTRW